MGEGGEVAAGAHGTVLGNGRGETGVQERYQRFFANVATNLSASALDYEATLRTLARLAVPTLADWCTVQVRHADGSIARYPIAYADPAHAAIAAEFEKYPVDPSRDSPAYRVIATGEPELISEITPEMVEAVAVDERHAELLRSLQIQSAMIVPLKARDRVLGSISLVSGNAGRRYAPRDL